MNTQDRILAAAIVELDEVGPTRLRMKRVAANAGVSIGAISMSFNNREGLIAAACAERYSNSVHETVERLRAVVHEPWDFDILVDELRQVVDDTLTPTRQSLRLGLVDSMAVAIHNEEAARVLSAISQGASDAILTITTHLEEQGYLSQGVDATSMARLLVTLLVGQVFVEHVEALGMDQAAWGSTMLEVIVGCLRDPRADAPVGAAHASSIR